MSSGIFAVANIGNHRLYVGEAHLLKERWAKMMALFTQGTFPSKQLQQAWQEAGDERHFTFHTAKQMSVATNIVGYRQFLKDTEAVE